MKRPQSITIIGTVLLLHGLLLSLFPGLLIGLLIAQRLTVLPTELATALATLDLPDLLVIASALVIGIFGVVSSIGLLRLRSWGWLMVMIVQGVSMIVNLITYLRGNADHLTYLGMLFAAVIVLYLNQHEFQQVFDVADYQTKSNPAPFRKLTTSAQQEPEETVPEIATRENTSGDSFV
jgi:hypothetical protein